MTGSRKPPVVWLRLVDRGTPNACWVVCNRVDEGAVPFVPEKAPNRDKREPYGS